jgi:hypothetical protein
MKIGSIATWFASTILLSLSLDHNAAAPELKFATAVFDRRKKSGFRED